MKIKRHLLMFCLVVLIVLFSSADVQADVCLRDLSNPAIISKPNPTIVVEFGTSVESEEVSFNYYPIDDDGNRDFENPEDVTDKLNLIESRSNSSEFRYNITGDITDGDYYTVYVKGEAKEYEETEDGEQEEIGSVVLEECTLFNVDFDPLDVSISSHDSDFISSSTEEITFESTRRATCYISESSDTISSMNRMDTTEGVYRHKNIHPGSSPFFVACEDESEEVVKTFDLTLDNEPPTTPEIDATSTYEDHPDVFLSTDSIRLKFDTEDLVSGIDIVNFTIVDSESQEPAMEWTSTDIIGNHFILSEDGEGDPLDLPDGKEYYVLAKSRNNAGLWSEESESDAFTVDTEYVEEEEEEEDLCDEQGVDCENGETCESDSNCLSGFCHPEDDICAEPSCSDEIQNGEETDVDCGGPDCDSCDLEMNCSADSDCQSGFCDPEDDVCLEPPEDDEDEFEISDPVDEPEEENNFMMSFLIVFLIIGVFGGGGYYAYMNWNQISYVMGLNQKSREPVQASSGTPSSSKQSKASSRTQQSASDDNKKSIKHGKAGVKDMSAKISHRLREKEKQRERSNLFGSFSSASPSKSSGEKKSDDDGLVKKEDIDNLFGDIK